MAHIAIIDGHPDPSEARLTHALANRYADAAQDAGHKVRRIDVARMEFPLLRSADEFEAGDPPQAIKEAQRDIAWANHLAIFYPLWDGDMPALLKGFFEQTFRPGFSLGDRGPRRFPKALLAGKSARVVITMGMPAVIYRAYFGAHSLKSLKRSMLGLCGISPVRATLLGGVAGACEGRRKKWLDRMAALAIADARPRESRRRGPMLTIATAGMLLAGAYAAYAAATWARYGNKRAVEPRDALLDRIMSEYEVGVRYSVVVNAPAARTFEAIHHTDFERSPVVRALFRAREMLMRAPHVERPLPHGLLEQVAALGWALVGHEPGRELIFGAVTQPWIANPTFRGLPPDEFVRFNEPGFAKIAFTLRVDPLTPDAAKAITETRVQTTDALSRSRFRRYWALLSPGIALIRLALLQQVKRDAETAYRAGKSKRGAVIDEAESKNQRSSV